MLLSIANSLSVRFWSFLFSYNSFEAVKMLIEYNADPSIENTDGATPLHFAARRGCAPTSRVLLSNESSSILLKCPDNSGMTPFHLACVSGSLKLCEMFLEKEADIFARTLELKSPLHLAALHGNETIVQLNLLTSKVRGWSKSKSFRCRHIKLCQLHTFLVCANFVL